MHDDPQILEISGNANQPATIADLDTRVLLTERPRCGATWVHVLADTELDFRSPTFARKRFCAGYFGGEKVLHGKAGAQPGTVGATRSLTLRDGWNQIMCRRFGICPTVTIATFCKSPGRHSSPFAEIREFLSLNRENLLSLYRLQSVGAGD
jgi:hypothetical protein